MEYNALVTTEDNKSFISSIEKRDISTLPDNDTLVKVKFSSLNYKDALSASLALRNVIKVSLSVSVISLNCKVTNLGF